MDVGMSLQRLHTAQLTENFPLGISDVSAERERETERESGYVYIQCWFKASFLNGNDG